MGVNDIKAKLKGSMFRRTARREAVVYYPCNVGHRVFDTVFPVADYIEHIPKQSRIRSLVR